MAGKRSRSKIIPEKMRRFAEFYHTSPNGVEAARLAGYQGDRAALSGVASRLLKDDRVAAYLAERREKLVAQTDDTITEVVDRLKQIALADMTNYATWTKDDVSFKPSAELDPSVSYAIKKIKGEKIPVLDSEGGLIENRLKFEIELCNKEAALKTLATYFGIDNSMDNAIQTLTRYGIFLKRDETQPSGWRVDSEA